MLDLLDALSEFFFSPTELFFFPNSTNASVDYLNALEISIPMLSSIFTIRGEGSRFSIFFQVHNQFEPQ
jgi:hypothetical protein